jgi:LPS-assembly lipoprotein
MWWYRNIFLVLLLGIPGCGFQPLHPPSASGATSPVEGVKIDVIADRSGQILRNLLLDRMNPDGTPVSPRYLLQVKVNETVSELAIRADAAATRGDVSLIANYVLRDSATGEAVLTGTSRAASGYDIVRSPYAALTARQAGRDRSLRVIADDIVNRLAVHLSRPKTEAKNP